MTSRTLCVVLLFSSLPAAGCGTVSNLAHQRPGQGGVIPFGGVKHDVWCIRTAANGDIGLRKHPRSESEQYPRVVLMLACAADLPLSAIGDVVTWPYTAAYTFINKPVPVPPIVVATPPEVLVLPTPPVALPTPPTPPQAAKSRALPAL